MSFTFLPNTTTKQAMTLMALTVLGAAMLVPSDVWAQGAPGLQDVSRSVGKNVRGSVPGIAMLSYVCGVFFAAAGLLKLKDWVNDGERNSITPAIMRLLVATLLIVLPHTIKIVTGTFFLRSDGQMDVNTAVHAPRLGAFCKSTQANCN